MQSYLAFYPRSCYDGCESGEITMVFQRKIYNRLLDWKEHDSKEKALLIEGARRIGKSTIAEEFGKNEYKSYMLIDFNDASEVVKNAFDRYLNDLDTFYMILQTEYNVTLYPGESLVIFDEVQLFPKARQSIKQLRIYSSILVSPSAIQNSSKSIGYILIVRSSDGMEISFTFSLIEISEPVSM